MPRLRHLCLGGKKSSPQIAEQEVMCERWAGRVGGLVARRARAASSMRDVCTLKNPHTVNYTDGWIPHK